MRPRKVTGAGRIHENPVSLTDASHGKADAGRKLDLFLLRHGEAGTRVPDASKDSERPLTRQGRIEIRRISRSLRNLGLKTDRIYTSPLARARETAETTARVLKIPNVEEWDELKPDGDRKSLYGKLVRTKDASVILVGHEPYLTLIITEMIGIPKARLVLKKGGLAKVCVTSLTPRVQGELRWLLTPKLMTRMS